MTAPDYAEADRAVEAWIDDHIGGVRRPGRVALRQLVHELLNAERDKAARLASELATVRAELEEATRKKGAMADELLGALAKVSGLQGELSIVRTRVGNVWLWQGDGYDCPSSLSCPVVMSADTLREFVAGTEKLTSAEAENARLRAALTTIGAWDCLNPPRPELLHDLPWLRRTVDAALAAPPPPAMCATCVAILAADVSRHFRECPLRAKYPEPAKAAMGGAKPARDGMRIILAAAPTDDALITCLACRRENCDLEMRVTPPHNNTGQAIAGMHRACLEKYTAAQGDADGAKANRELGVTRPHIVDGEFQSDKYPTTPRGKVPLSVKDPAAQDLLWQYAQRRRSVDAEFADDLEFALTRAGYVGPDPDGTKAMAAPSKGVSLDSEETFPETIFHMKLDGRSRKYIPVDGEELKSMLEAADGSKAFCVLADSWWATAKDGSRPELDARTLKFCASMVHELRASAAKPQAPAVEAKERQDAMFTMAEFRERAEVEAVGHVRSAMMLRLATEYERALAEIAILQSIVDDRRRQASEWRTERRRLKADLVDSNRVGNETLQAINVVREVLAAAPGEFVEDAARRVMRGHVADLLTDSGVNFDAELAHLRGGGTEPRMQAPAVEATDVQWAPDRIRVLHAGASGLVVAGTRDSVLSERETTFVRTDLHDLALADMRAALKDAKHWHDAHVRLYATVTAERDAFAIRFGHAESAVREATAERDRAVGWLRTMRRDKGSSIDVFLAELDAKATKETM